MIEDPWKPKISKETASKLLQTHIGGISRRGRRKRMPSPHFTAFWILVLLGLVMLTMPFWRS